jgi:hypothetical protein
MGCHYKGRGNHCRTANGVASQGAGETGADRSLPPQCDLRKLRLTEPHLKSTCPAADAGVQCLITCQVVQHTGAPREFFDLFGIRERVVAHPGLARHVAQGHAPDRALTPVSCVDFADHWATTRSAQRLSTGMRWQDASPTLPADSASLMLLGRRCTLASINNRRR